MNKALDGIKVLDFGRFIAGPYCSTLLSDLGAEVIRIDKVGESEDRMAGSVEQNVDGGMFLSVNRNKKSLSLDPKSTEGQEILRKLIIDADVVVANMPYSSLKDLGIDYESLCVLKKDIILASINMFGAKGPLTNHIGFDGLAQAMNGSVSITGLPDMPIRTPVPYVDFGTAFSVAYGILAAIIHRSKTGEGQHLQGSLMNTALIMTNAVYVGENNFGLIRERTGNRQPYSAPTDIFKTLDGSVYVVVTGNIQFKRWCKILGVEDFLQDPKYDNDVHRGINHHQLIELMNAWCANRTTEEVFSTLQKNKIAVAPVLTLQEAFENENFQKSDYFKTFEHPQQKLPVTVTNNPVQFQVNIQDYAGYELNRPPLSGEHNNEILFKLGYNSDDIIKLQNKNVIGASNRSND